MDRITFERELTDKVALELGIANSDAQGIVEANAQFVSNCITIGLNINMAFKLIENHARTKIEK